LAQAINVRVNTLRVWFIEGKFPLEHKQALADFLGQPIEVIEQIGFRFFERERRKKMSQEIQKSSEAIAERIRGEAFENAEEIIRRRNKKPAHEVIVEMIRETVESLDDQSEPKLEAESILILLKVGILAALLEILKRMVVPEKHIGEVLEVLHDIRGKCDSAYAEKLLPMKFFTILHMSQPYWGKMAVKELEEAKTAKDNELIGKEKEVDHKIPHDHIKEAEAREVRAFNESDAPQEEKTARINSLMNRAGSCVFCKRAILKVFGT
jgi:hypothetical protein